MDDRRWTMDNGGEDGGSSTPSSIVHPSQAQDPSSAEGFVLQGVPAAPGRALGPALRYEVAPAAVSAERINDDHASIATEQALLRASLEAAQGDLFALAGEVRSNIGEEEAAIFEAQALMAADPTLSDRAEEL